MEKDGLDSRVWKTPNPIDSSMPADWRQKMQAEIEERVRELKLLQEGPI